MPRASGAPSFVGGGRRSRSVVPLRTTVAVLALAMAATLAGCSSSSNTATTSSGAASPSAPVGSSSATITIRNFAFSPATLTVTPGAVVKVVNEDQVGHTLTASKGRFDTGTIPAGQSKTFTAPTAAGNYAYICSIHTFMSGTLVVS